MAAPISPFNSAALGLAAASAAATSPLVGLQPGAVIAARVLALLDNGQAVLAIGNALIEATAQIPLSIGATVQLAVQNTGNGTTLQLVGPVAPQSVFPQSVAPQAVTPLAAASQAVDSQVVTAPTAAPQPVALASPGTIPGPSAAVAIAVSAHTERAPAGDTPSASLASGSPVFTPSVTTPVLTANASMAAKPATLPVAAADLPVTVAPQVLPSPAADAAAALQAAVRAAAGTQNGLSPLYAEIAAAVDLPALPEAVQREALRLLSLRPSLDGNLSAKDVKQAFMNSGLFLEARIAESAQPPNTDPAGIGSGSSRNAAPVDPLPPAAKGLPASDLKAALIVFRQVLAIALAEGGDAGTDPAVLAVADAAPVVLDPHEVTADSAAPARPNAAPVVLDPHEVTADPAAPARANAAPVPAGQVAQISEQMSDQAAAQISDRLSDQISDQISDQVSDHVSGQAPDRTPTPAPLAPRFGLSNLRPPVATAPMPRVPVSPPPPFRNGPVTAQPPAIATIDATTPLRVAVQTLIAATDSALARQTLLQAASLSGPFPNLLDSDGPRWNFEVPFAIAQGPRFVTNVAQFEISRDGKAAVPANGSGPVWRARFSIDIAPIGRVHAQIGLRGVRTAIALWAENPEGAERLRGGAAKLADALRAADLDAGELVVRDGAPRARTVAAGHFLDRAS